jgi:hypothetical protein
VIESDDLFTLTIRKYKDGRWGWRWMGEGRRALDLGRISFIFECWWTRG